MATKPYLQNEETPAVVYHDDTTRTSGVKKMNDNNPVIIYQTEDGRTQVDVRMENDTVWLTQAQMTSLFRYDGEGGEFD